jgi:membrane protein YdbS with pleckstrin-like domain
MRCPKCNQAVESDSKFCKHCGAPFTTDPVAAAAAPAAPAVPGAVAADKAANPYRDPAFEKEVWSGRPAWRASYGAWFLWAILSLAAIYGAHRAGADATVDKVLWILIGVAALWLLVRQAMISLGVHYRLTTQRLFIQRGMLSRVTDQMELVRVDDVRVRQGIIDRLVNTGDIEVIGSDKTNEDTQLHNISAPNDVAEELRKNVRAVRARGTLFVENV